MMMSDVCLVSGLTSATEFLPMYNIEILWILDWKRSVWWTGRVCRDGLEWLNANMILTGSSVVRHRKLEGVREKTCRHDVESIEENQVRNQLTRVHREQWPLKWILRGLRCKVLWSICPSSILCFTFLHPLKLMMGKGCHFLLRWLSNIRARISSQSKVY